jgi:dTMP kinase
MDPEESLRRVNARNARLGESFTETRFDQEALEFHRRVRQAFLEIARREPRRVVLVPAQAAPDTVEATLWSQVSTLLAARGYRVA